MWVLVGVQFFITMLFLFFGWALLYKKAYWLISGFATRPEEEQEELIRNGSPQKTGKLMFATAIGMLILLPLYFLPFKYAIEVQFGFMLLFLMGGMVYLSKYEVVHKRKKSYLISSVLFIAIIGFVGTIYMIGLQSYDLIVKDDKFEITGPYGEEWDLNKIQSIHLLDEMPEVTWKNNGFGLATMSKGYFTVTDYGVSLLFIRKDSPPYLYIKVAGDRIFINGENSTETKEWYQSLRR
ncbi:DUF3784 domain-containing protein [Mesobacillus maritimus]|uniref:DUF3784 domain-containing protein n=1 Tax=Mesobacillus maritimus TaxID=1643336 RepID=UPI00203B2EA5|nr:DUF3784 domain-containing protein [Mesobacillus maritimus]MCM3585623.1 DUF3784 domain-containing protein [Mesobacillus maritimus]MCM3669095.1 DUF3784 domain-containing protein [Mesobacillus maritimus]